MRNALLVLFFAVGCSSSTTESAGDASTASDGASTSDVTTYDAPADFCKALADRAMRCETGAPSDCSKQLACYQAAVRPEDQGNLLGCLAERDCKTIDDKCVANAASKYQSDGTVKSYVDACLAKRTSCSNAFSDDYCGYDYGLFVDSMRAAVKACLDKPCEEVKACVQAAYATAGC
jgi:hypothetical protein